MLVDPERFVPRAELARLRRVSPVRGLLAVGFTWSVIVACFAAYAVFPSLFTVLLAWLVMSGRQLALAILMHEGAHGLLLPNKRLNDLLANWLTAYPMMADMPLYRKVHFLHHRHTWTERDPDLALAANLPVTRASFRRKVLRDLTGQTAYARHRAMLRLAAGLSPAERGLSGRSLLGVIAASAVALRGFLIAHALMLGALLLVGIPEAYLFIWWLPALTGFSLVLRLRSIAEHACVRDPNDPLLQTRTTLAPGWVRFLLAPHHVNYHLEHHLFMTVPHYNLPRAHRLLRERGVLERAEVASSYLQVLRRATSKPA
ncbi:MAG: fatty acid desaturase family protein [Myxococcales bacterium]|nr:fatty acid desaturase family protein [Myxococcales bacterium]MDD9968592.1 fatty acid desaturase family protein [Myxococcales bacterium]